MENLIGIFHLQSIVFLLLIKKFNQPVLYAKQFIESNHNLKN